MGSKNAERGATRLKGCHRALLTEFVDEQQNKVIRSHPWNSDRAYQGYSINYLARRTGGRVFGVDSLHGMLGLIVQRLTPKTLIIMDDYHGFWGYRNGQFRAWAEFVAAHELVYRCAGSNRHAVLIWNVQSGAAEPPREQIVPQ